MKDLDKMFTYATCYESEVRFPTNQKLLWERVQWNYKQIKTLLRLLKIKIPRTKISKLVQKTTFYPEVS
jgi:hypothetical protein